MPKNQAELYLAFHIGLTPKDLIKKGIPKWRVYNYYRRYNKTVKPAFYELMKK